jgi:hypothetical protein
VDRAIVLNFAIAPRRQSYCYCKVAVIIVLGLFPVILGCTPIFAQTAPWATLLPKAQGGDPLAFRNLIVFDQQGLGLEAFRLLIPKDWIFSGGVIWNFTNILPEASIVYMVTSPDGNSAIQQFPPLNMYWSQDPQSQYSFVQMGRTIMQPLGAIDFLLRVFIPQARQGASDMKVIETQLLPGAAQQALAINNLTLNLFGQISPFTFPFETRADAGRVKLEYTLNGRRMVEDFTAVINYFIATMPTITPGAYAQSVTWTPSVYSFRAPAEQMPVKIRQLQISLFSRYNNPVWAVSYTRLCAIVTREQLRQQQAIFARYQQIHKTLEECNDIIWQTYQNRSAAQDRMFDHYSQALRGVDRYVDPINNWNIDIPTGYDNVWTNGMDYVFSDSPSFNPNVISTGNWQKMIRKR